MFFIDNITNLIEDVNFYAQQFPDNFTTLGDVLLKCSKHEQDPVGSIFGISVSPEWKDKCYGFEVDGVRNNTTTVLRYLGTWKT